MPKAASKRNVATRRSQRRIAEAHQRVAASCCFPTLNRDRMRLGVAQGLIVEIGPANFDCHRADTNIRIAYDVQIVDGSDGWGVFQRLFDGQVKLVIGIEFELSRCIEVGPIGDIVT